MAFKDIVDLQGTHNTRDLGGYYGYRGYKVKRGQLFRSDSIHALTERDIEVLKDRYHLALDIDLRSEQEKHIKPDREIPGCRYVGISITSKTIQGLTIGAPALFEHYPQFALHYRRLFALNKEGSALEGMKNLYLHYVDMESNQIGFTEFIKTVMEADGPVLFHCADGKDRTGMAACYLLHILGVAKEDILDDYAASAEYLEVKVQERRAALHRVEGLHDENLIENICLLGTVRRCWLEAALDDIDKNYGGMDRYVREILKISDGTITALRNKYLEK